MTFCVDTYQKFFFENSAYDNYGYFIGCWLPSLLLFHSFLLFLLTPCVILISKEKARYIAKMSAECNIVSEHYMPTSNEENQPITFVQNAGNHFLNDEQAYVDRFIGDLMDVVCAWAEGASFARLCELTNTFEGSIIRCIRRLEELLRQMHNAAKVAGNSELENKFLEGRYLHPLCNVA
uniref:SJCHGC05845 protein n=1 Tax=Schistosoma japonicum TaxID=6182 RepID=Q5DI28_SCHJA|nr:SJCHGC05845 protein [Schistosoma japonicum]